MDEIPHRAIIDHQATFSQFGDKPVQGKGTLPAASDKPNMMLPANPSNTLAPSLLAPTSSKNLESETLNLGKRNLATQLHFIPL